MAGFVSGTLAWGTYTSLNYQILLYLSSRVVVGLWKRAGIAWTQQQQQQGTTTTANHQKNMPTTITSRWLYRFGAGLIWGLSMILFEECPHVLHPSLRKSMDEIFRRPIPSSQSIQLQSS